MNKKSVVIVGAGPAGLLAAYRLARYNLYKPTFSIRVVDKGRSIKRRHCAVRKGKECTHCEPCNIMSGLGGAGTFSDCKLSLKPSSGVGGNIYDYIGDNLADDYAKEVDDILSHFDKYSDEREIIGTKTEKYLDIENKLKESGLSLVYNPTKHIGTEDTVDMMHRLYHHLKALGVDFIFEDEVVNIDLSHPTIKVLNLKSGFKCLADYIILAPGRSGNEWLMNTAKSLGMKTRFNKFDIGYRVELPSNVLKELTDNLYDMKITCNYCQDGQELKVRTFCTNPNGYVSEEHYDDNIVLANGHSYAGKKSNNTNFALLVTLPFDGKNIIKNYNRLSDGKIVVEDFKQFARFGNTTDKTEPTLKTAVNINDSESIKKCNNEIPVFIKDALVDFLSRLNEVYPGVCSTSTNLYGLEAKFYSDIIEVNNVFESNISKIYCIGDGAGLTRGIIQSGCQGLVVADNIIDRLKDDISHE